MSKYFDDTYGTGNPAATVGPSPAWPAPQTGKQDGSDSAPKATPGGLSSRSVEVPKTVVPVSRTLRLEFAEADAMGNFQESYRGLRTRLMRLRAEKGLRSVAVTSAVKGEGKTITSLHLAYTCAQLQGMKVLLVDGDIRSFGLSHLLRAPAGQGVADILAEKAEVDQAVLPTDLPNLHFLRGGSSAGAAAELLASRRLLQLLDWCAENYSLVIVDTPPILNLTDTELITAACDGTVLVVREQQTQTEQLHECVSHMDTKKLLGVVMNAAQLRSKVYKYGYSGVAVQ
jgi:capsular exopolysaccharide synthesis family protein